MWNHWRGAERHTFTYAMDGGLLLGVAMLYMSRLTTDVLNGGAVTIDPLPWAPARHAPRLLA